MTPNSSFLKYGDFQFNFSEFSYKKDQKYNPWLWSNKSIYNVPTIKIPPGTLKDCKELFEKDVLPIKKLAKDIGDLNKIILNEQNDFFCMMIVTFLPIRFLQKLIKNYNLTE